MARKCYYQSLKSLGRKEKHLHRRDVSTKQDQKEGRTEAMVVLSASTKKHRRPRPEPTFDVMLVPLDPSCLKRTVQIGKDLDAMISDGIAGYFISQPFKEKGYEGHSTLTTLEDATYDVLGLTSGYAAKACLGYQDSLYHDKGLPLYPQGSRKPLDRWAIC
ncbi:hypothetical protein Cgig2_032319 [Carnegiea gigantea]|uniref:Uncharacterized protein n=1 Tax=Carnegiea gigantea TaxID=171969 RepID=A0A9Q1KG83_9CARY|nr:hypothetical protein Cgig2_032319 [Carnegiea gigantea]